MASPLSIKRASNTLKKVSPGLTPMAAKKVAAARISRARTIASQKKVCKGKSLNRDCLHYFRTKQAVKNKVAGIKTPNPNVKRSRLHLLSKKINKTPTGSIKKAW